MRTEIEIPEGLQSSPSLHTMKVPATDRSGTSIAVCQADQPSSLVCVVSSEEEGGPVYAWDCQYLPTVLDLLPYRHDLSLIENHYVAVAEFVAESGPNFDVVDTPISFGGTYFWPLAAKGGEA